MVNTATYRTARPLCTRRTIAQDSAISNVGPASMIRIRPHRQTGYTVTAPGFAPVWCGTRDIAARTVLAFAEGREPRIPVASWRSSLVQLQAAQRDLQACLVKI